MKTLESRLCLHLVLLKRHNGHLHDSLSYRLPPLNPRGMYGAHKTLGLLVRVAVMILKLIGELKILGLRNKA